MKINRGRLRKLAGIAIRLHREDLDYQSEYKDDEVNKAWITEQLEAGNPWAWCCVEVMAEHLGMYGNDYLGCCSYLSREDFIENSGYYKGMVDEAVDELATKIEAAFTDEHLVDDDEHQSTLCITCIASEAA